MILRFSRLCTTPDDGIKRETQKKKMKTIIKPWRFISQPHSSIHLRLLLFSPSIPVGATTLISPPLQLSFYWFSIHLSSASIVRFHMLLLFNVLCLPIHYFRHQWTNEAEEEMRSLLQVQSYKSTQHTKQPLVYLVFCDFWWPKMLKLKLFIYCCSVNRIIFIFTG